MRPPQLRVPVGANVLLLQAACCSSTTLSVELHQERLVYCPSVALVSYPSFQFEKQRLYLRKV